MSREITREELSAAGVQYGHQTKRWNPKMKDYIFGVKNKNHIIDLEKTITHLNAAQKLLESLGSKQQKYYLLELNVLVKMLLKKQL
uniref:Small ribosomal subunit protein uS2 n=1 Tax=Mycoplasma feriruminatoris TaxID=1179777 RepID=A0A654IJ55_9MOLU|nr:30S ribosomal protein S2 [Mycoplasma feriruminatoris]